MEWETVIGLEIHAQLATKSKIFSGASTAYGAAPNTQACAIDLGLPGERIILADSPSDGARRVIEQLEPGDVALLLVHDERKEVVALLTDPGCIQDGSQAPNPDAAGDPSGPEGR